MKVLLINSAKTMRGGESQTLALAARLPLRGIETACAVRSGSELLASIPAGCESIGLRFEPVPLLTPLSLRRFIILVNNLLAKTGWY